MIMKQRELPITREKIKERIKAKNNKIKRYQSRINQYQRNCTFKNDQRKFYSSLETVGINEKIRRLLAESMKSWYYREKDTRNKIGWWKYNNRSKYMGRLPGYSAAFLDWTGAELAQIDKRTRKLMTMHQALNPKIDVARIYLSRKEGGRGLIIIEDTIESSQKIHINK